MAKKVPAGRSAGGRKGPAAGAGESELAEKHLPMPAADAARDRETAEALLNGLVAHVRALAHVLNNGIAITYGNASLLQERLTDGESRSMVQDILGSLDRMSSLARNLSSLSHWVPFHAVEVDVAGLLEGRRAEFQTLVGAGRELRMKVPTRPTAVVTDPAYLQVALHALLINAAEATPTGGTVALRCALGTVPPEVKVQYPGCADHAGKFVVITVTDSGKGMSAEAAARAFEPGYTTKHGGNTGLGLWLVTALVVASAGAAWIDGNSASGVTMAIAIPLCKTQPTI